MAGHISGLRFQKRTAERVNVYLDDQYAFAVPAVTAARLHIGQFLTDAEIAELRGEDAISKAYERAIRLLSFRPRSTTEVRRYLIEAEVDEEAVEATLTRLTEQGYLNDDEFARYWVENRSQFRPRSLRALQYELRQKGVSDEAISRALSDVDEELMVRKIALASARRFKRLAPQDFRRKLTAHLARKGFSYDLIKPLVDEMLDSTRYEMLSDIESEEMDHDE